MFLCVKLITQSITTINKKAVGSKYLPAFVHVLKYKTNSHFLFFKIFDLKQI